MDVDDPRAVLAVGDRGLEILLTRSFDQRGMREHALQTDAAVES